MVKAVLVVAGLLAALPAQAALFDDLGGQAGIDRIVEGGVTRFLADPRIASTFADSNMDRVRRMLKLQFCAVAEGPCTYNGHSMTVAHRGLNLGTAQFNALVEDLQDEMSADGIGNATQNRLLGRLAPMYRDVVTR